MQRLTIMTLGAALLGLAAFAYDSAAAQTQKVCSTHAVDIYFQPDSTAFNTFSQQLVERVAQEARSCGAKQVVVSASGNERAKVVSDKFRSLGLKVIVMKPQASAGEGESVADRAVTIRVAGLPNAVG